MRIIQKHLPGPHDVFGKQLDGAFFLVSVDRQPVHLGVIIIGLQQVQRAAVVGGLERAEHVVGKDGAIRRQLAEDRFADVGGHAAEACVGVINAQVLMFVIIAVGDLHLADCLGRKVAPGLREHANLQPPIRWDAQIRQDRGAHGKLTRERIAEAAQVIEVVAVADHTLQCNQQRADQEPGDPAVQLVLTHTRIEPFGHLIGEVRIDHRVDQTRQHFVGVGQNIAIMDGHHRAVRAADQIAQRRPDILALALLCRCQPHLFQPRAQLKHPGAVVPDHDVVLPKPGKELFRVTVLRLIRAVEADDDAVQIGNLAQLREDIRHRVPFKLGVEAGQDERDFSCLGEDRDFVAKRGCGLGAQIVQSCDVSVLMEIRHLA